MCSAPAPLTCLRSGSHSVAQSESHDLHNSHVGRTLWCPAGSVVDLAISGKLSLIHILRNVRPGIGGSFWFPRDNYYAGHMLSQCLQDDSFNFPYVSKSD